MNLGGLVKLIFWIFFWLQVFSTNCNWFSKCSLKVNHVTRNMDLLQTIKTFSITNSINSYWHALFSSLTKKKMFSVATLVLHNLITSGLPHTFSYIFSHMDMLGSWLFAIWMDFLVHVMKGTQIILLGYFSHFLNSCNNVELTKISQTLNVFMTLLLERPQAILGWHPDNAW
jgi:hypothetical protein